MNLSPEEKKVGKQNFDEATGTTRREFLKRGIAATVVAGGAGAMGAYYFKYEKLDEPLRVGIIGTGDEGNVLIGALNPDYIDVVAIADIRPYSLYRAYHGDWYSKGAHAARPGLLSVYKDKYGWKSRDEAKKHITEYTDDYQELLDNPDVEAVIIALPLHLHHPAAIAAMRKGKHVLTEKLMGHSVAQCKEMARVAADAKDPQGNPIQLAVGHQRHYSILYANAVDQIRRGLIGDIHHIRAQWHRANMPGNDSWKPPLPCKFMPEAEYISMRREARKTGSEDKVRAEHRLLEEYYAWQKYLKNKAKTPKDIEEWQAKVVQKRHQIDDITDELAQKWGYNATTIGGVYNRPAIEELIRWRLWERTGGGLMAELGSHQLDAASIFISAQHGEGKHVHPLSVTGVGGRHLFPLDRECEDHVYCSFEFPGKDYFKDEEMTEVADPNKKVVVTYSSINGNGFGGYGEIAFGTKGTLILEREEDAMLFKGSNTASRIEVKQGKDGPAMDTYETGGGAGVAQAATASDGPPSRGYREEIEHWAWCIKNPAPDHQPHCGPVVALGDAVIALSSNLAIRNGARIEFDPKWFDPNDDATPDGEKPRRTADIS
jgi:predicted dehydrogenase